MIFYQFLNCVRNVIKKQRGFGKNNRRYIAGICCSCKKISRKIMGEYIKTLKRMLEYSKDH